MRRTKKTFYKLERKTVRQVFAWGMAPEPKEKFTSRAYREWANLNKRRFRYNKRRHTIGYARAFLGPHFFAGCYPGAEND